MAFKLSKGEAKTLSDFVTKLQTLKSEIEQAEEDMRFVLSSAADRVNDAVRAYNGALSDVESFVNDKRENWRGEYDDKSEGWQEGDRGQSVDSFIQDWEGVSFDNLEEVQIVEPDSVADEASHADELEALPTEADY